MVANSYPQAHLITVELVIKYNYILFYFTIYII